MPKVKARALQPVVTGHQVGEHLESMLTVNGLMEIAKPLEVQLRMTDTNVLTLRETPPRKKRKAKKPKERSVKISITPPTKSGYFARVKSELNILLCTNDKKYAQLRKKLTSIKNQHTIVAAIAAAIGAIIGLSAAVIMPFVAIILMTLLQVGLNAYCSVD